MSLKVYVAARYDDMKKAEEIKEALQSRGFITTSRWSTGYQEEKKKMSEAYKRWCAMADLEDLDKADIIVFYSPKKWSRIGSGGRHWEVGYAWGHGKRIYILGSRCNIFHSLPRVYSATNLPDLFRKIRRYENAYNERAKTANFLWRGPLTITCE